MKVNFVFVVEFEPASLAPKYNVGSFVSQLLEQQLGNHVAIARIPFLAHIYFPAF